MQSHIEGLGPSANLQRADSVWVHQFGQELEAFPPFDALPKRAIIGALGGAQRGDGIAGPWVWQQLLRGIRAQDILELATKSIEENRYEASEVRAVRGITISAPFKLTGNASLVPREQLVECHERTRAFGEGGLEATQNSAALIQTIVVEPAFVPAAGLLERPSLQAERDRRDAYAARLRLALGIASGGPVEMPSVYAQASPDNIFGAASSGLFYRQIMFGFAPYVAFAGPATLAIYAELEAMKSEALEIAVNRLLRSRLGQSLEDRILDLGMAVEIILMHQTQKGEGKSEITNKLSNRGAWLVGETPSDRFEVAALLGKLYSARSAVVHTGIAKPDLRTCIPKFDALVSQVIRAVLRRGSFPDWKKLVLGGCG